MKKLINLLSIFLFVTIFCTLLTGCDILNSLIGGSGLNENVENYNNELETSSGKWLMKNDEDTYFILDGSKDVMTFSYIEDGIEKYDGKYRVIYRGVGKDISTPLSFIFTRSDKDKEDWLGCYVEDFESDFTQFTIMSEEENLGLIDTTIYTYIYRLSEIPYKMGCYVLESNEYKEESNTFKYSDQFCIPSGTYIY